MPLSFKKLLGCPMNNVFNRHRVPDKKKGKSDENTDSDIDELELIHGCYSEDPDLILMRKTIDRNPELFILNNLMMCVQFFQNFEEEILEIRQKLVSVKEPSFNASLLPQKRALLPDVLQEHVGHNLKFTSARQTLRPTLEPLQPIRVYIVHENFEISEQNDANHYSTMDDVTTYNLWLKPSDYKGYVYLQHLECIKKRNTEGDLSSIEEKSDTIFEKCLYDEKNVNEIEPAAKLYSSQSLPEFLNLEDDQQDAKQKRDSLCFEEKSSEVSSSRKSFQRLNSRNLVVAKQRATSESPASSTSSGYNTSGDSDYGYSGSSSFKELSKNAEIPNSCFKMITYAQSGKVYDPREEKRENLTSKQKRIKDELRRYNYNIWYIHSTNFMRYFYKLFKQNFAQVLGFDEAAVSDARYFNSVIYCDKIDVLGSSLYTKIEPYEIIPCVWSQWPECFQEWFVRERGAWPDFEIMQKIKEFGCYIVPESFIPRQESNPMKKIEWQLNFPAAEKYLETYMNHAQTRVLLIAMMLHKTFIRPVDTLLGLTTSHIRNKLFWMIEQGTLTWPEHRTGECLLKLLTGIYQNISQNPPLLKDYFMKEKNLFQNIPSECLLQSQKQINRILTNPIMYLIYAIENIHYKQSFFPRLDCDELLRILTLDLVPLVNPQIVENHPRSNSRANSMHYSRSNASTRYWRNSSNKNDYTSITRRSVTNKTLINTRAMMKNPIIEISVRCQEMENTRLSILLDFFIRHFIRTAQKYHQYGAWKLKSIYITHVERLCILLSEKDGCAKSNVRIYMKKVNVLKNLLIKVQPGQEPPETPQRNADQPVFSKPLNERFVFNSEFETDTINESVEVQLYSSCTDLKNADSDDLITAPDTLQLRSSPKSKSAECVTFDHSDEHILNGVNDDTHI